jgi:hypothetical protein
MGAERSRSPWTSNVGTAMCRISSRKSYSTIIRLQAKAIGKGLALEMLFPADDQTIEIVNRMVEEEIGFAR